MRVGSGARAVRASGSRPGGWLLVGLLLVGLAACKKPSREAVGPLPDLGYPSCIEGEPLPEGEVVGEGFIRSGPTMRERSVVEHFELRQRDCLLVVRTRQEWPMSTADLDVVFDAEGLPLRVWKRTTIPDASGPTGHLDIRRFELRSERVGLTRRGPTRSLEHYELRGERPQAVIGPSRGLLSAWFRRAQLPVGGRLRVPVLDVRESIELIREVTLRRLEDDDVEGLGRVRVYTIYGREPIFADENDIVVGDLFGMRPDATLDTPAPAPIPMVGPVDPVAPL